MKLTKNYKETDKDIQIIKLEEIANMKNIIKIRADADWDKISLKKKIGKDGNIIILVKLKTKKTI